MRTISNTPLCITLQLRWLPAPALVTMHMSESHRRDTWRLEISLLLEAKQARMVAHKTALLAQSAWARHLTKECDPQVLAERWSLRRDPREDGQLMPR